MPINKLLIFHMKNICGVSSTPKFSMNHRADKAARTAASLSGCTHGLTRPGSGPPLSQVLPKRRCAVYEGSGAGGAQRGGIREPPALRCFSWRKGDMADMVLPLMSEGGHDREGRLAVCLESRVANSEQQRRGRRQREH